METPPRVADVRELNRERRGAIKVQGRPRPALPERCALLIAPPGTDPAARAPAPPARDLRVEVRRVGVHVRGECRERFDEPAMSSVQIAVVNEHARGEVVAGGRLEIVNRYTSL